MAASLISIAKITVGLQAHTGSQIHFDRRANFGLSDPDVRHQGKTSSRKML
jgi:hypothetical protein